MKKRARVSATRPHYAGFHYLRRRGIGRGKGRGKERGRWKGMADDRMGDWTCSVWASLHFLKLPLKRNSKGEKQMVGMAYCIVHIVSNVR